jgi:hypothetical protein
MEIETEITITKYNVGVIAGWLAIGLGILSGLFQYFDPNLTAFIFMAVGLIFGGITVTSGGPWRVIEKRMVKLRELPKH